MAKDILFFIRKQTGILHFNRHFYLYRYEQACNAQQLKEVLMNLELTESQIDNHNGCVLCFIAQLEFVGSLNMDFC